MTLDEFRETLKNSSAPDGLSPYLLALWYEKNGDWTRAHETVQEIDDSTGAWIHAYLHRREGDQQNSSYWYGQTGKTMPSYSLDQEWDEIAQALLVA